jgi:hypothetical protein
MRAQTVAQAIAASFAAWQNCKRSGNTDWEVRHSERIRRLLDLMPSGSGFDSGTLLDFARTTPEKLVFTTAFHHMDESGGYAGWTSHLVTVRPSFVHDMTLTVSGRDRNDIKEYIVQTFEAALSAEVPPDRQESILQKIPSDSPVKPLASGDTAVARATCGTCGLSWDDGIATSMTPAPSARCPFEPFHNSPDGD